MIYLKACVPNKIEDLNIYVFNTITEKDESNILTKFISYKSKLDGIKCSSNQQWSNDKCWCGCKKHHLCEEDYIWNPAICSCQNEKYLASIINDSVITCNEIIDAEQILFHQI